MPGLFRGICLANCYLPSFYFYRYLNSIFTSPFCSIVQRLRCDRLTSSTVFVVRLFLSLSPRSFGSSLFPQLVCLRSIAPRRRSSADIGQIPSPLLGGGTSALRLGLPSSAALFRAPWFMLRKIPSFDAIPLVLRFTRRWPCALVFFLLHGLRLRNPVHVIRRFSDRRKPRLGK